MQAAIICIIALVGSWGHAKAEPPVEGRVRLDSGAPVLRAQVLLFDLVDLRAPPLAATTDGSGHFTLPLATLAGALPVPCHTPAVPPPAVAQIPPATRGR